MGLSVIILVGGLVIIYLSLQRLGLIGKSDESANAG